MGHQDELVGRMAGRLTAMEFCAMSILDACLQMEGPTLTSETPKHIEFVKRKAREIVGIYQEFHRSGDMCYVPAGGIDDTKRVGGS